MLPDKITPQGYLAAWTQLFLIGWTFVFLLLPFFNRDRLRAGDMVAGTWVVTAPKAELLPDLARDDSPAERTRQRAGAATGRPETATAPFPFSETQLETYGIYELQTLEDVLRRKGPRAQETLEAVALRISQKIGWLPPDGRTPEPRAFLEAYYAALRAHLEKRMLFGQRREHKNDSGKAGSGPSSEAPH